MFEFIGMVVVAWVVWKVVKSIYIGWSRAQLLKDIAYASYLGVPTNTARRIREDHIFIKVIHGRLASHDPNFRMLDVYEQYGHAILVCYFFEHVTGESTNPYLDILALIFVCAQQNEREISLPNLRYDRVWNCAEASEYDREWYPDYVGMWFWINIGGVKYYVDVVTIDPDKEGGSGVIISAKIVVD